MTLFDLIFMTLIIYANMFAIAEFIKYRMNKK